VTTVSWASTVAFQTPFDWLGVWFIWICFAAIASLLIFLFIAIWLYKDAESRGMSGALWVLLLVVAGFFFPVVGGIVVLVIYLIARIEHPPGYGYGYAGYPPAAPPPAYAPPYPGPPTPTQPPAPAAVPTKCRTCGAPLPANAAFCSNCGSKV
jgi:hypothetical protein